LRSLGDAKRRPWAEKFAAAASIAGEGTPFEVQKTHILLGFSGWHGAC
jgi:hypothetical protein